jgi:hypothetical protein
VLRQVHFDIWLRLWKNWPFLNYVQGSLWHLTSLVEELAVFELRSGMFPVFDFLPPKKTSIFCMIVLGSSDWIRILRRVRIDQAGPWTLYWHLGRQNSSGYRKACADTWLCCYMYVQYFKLHLML